MANVRTLRTCCTEAFAHRHVVTALPLSEDSRVTTLWKVRGPQGDPGRGFGYEGPARPLILYHLKLL